MPLSLRFKTVPKPVLVVFAIVVAVKLGVLLAFGPALQNDTLGYDTYADAILSGAFRHVDLATDPMPVTLTRMIGYPAVIAAAKILAGRGLDLGRRVVSVRGFAVGDRDGLSPGAGVSARSLDQPRGRRGASDLHAVHGRPGGADRQPHRQHRDDCDVHPGSDRVAPHDDAVAGLSRRRRAHCGRVPNEGCDRLSGDRARSPRRCGGARAAIAASPIGRAARSSFCR